MKERIKVDAILSASSPKDQSYWEDRLQKNWGIAGVGYLGHGSSYNEWLYAVRKHVLQNEIKHLQVDLPEARIADIGSGTGFWIDTWKYLGARNIAGTDITRVSVERLRALHPDCRIVQLDIGADMAEQDFKGKFDVVGAFDVLFHITDDDRFRQAIRNCAYMLAPNGYFLFSDNFVHDREIRLDHQVNRSANEIQQILSDNRLKIVRRVPMFVLMNAPMDTSSRWPMFLWRAFFAPLHFMPILGGLYGLALFPFELALTRLLRESPTTELLICQQITPAS